MHTQTCGIEPGRTSPRPFGADDFRYAMGHFASGVTVVTGMDGSEPVGFTCQAFASVSLDPPLVLFCADHRGASWARIRATGRFCVNVLAAHQDELCARFGSRAGRRFDGLDWHPSPWGCPALPDVLLRVHGQIAEVHRAGDHHVVIGEVLGLEQPQEESAVGRRGRQAAPMLFFRGRLGL